MLVMQGLNYVHNFYQYDLVCIRILHERGQCTRMTAMHGLNKLHRHTHITHIYAKPKDRHNNLHVLFSLATLKSLDEIPRRQNLCLKWKNCHKRMWWSWQCYWFGCHYSWLVVLPHMLMYVYTGVFVNVRVMSLLLLLCTRMSYTRLLWVNKAALP